MQKKYLSVLLVIVLAVTSLNIEIYAAEAERSEFDQTQQSESEASVETGQIKWTDVMEKSEPVESVEYTEEAGTDEEEPEEIEDTDLTEKDSQEAAEDDLYSEEETTQTETVSETLIDETEDLETITNYEIAPESETKNQTETETLTEEALEIMYESVIEEYKELMIELAAADNTYKITEHQLFMQAPQYLLSNNSYDTYLTRCFAYTRQAMEGVNETQTWWAAFMKGLKDGSEFLSKEIAAACGLTDSNYDKQKKDMAGELVREYMGNKEYLSSSAEELAKQLKKLDKIADKDLKLQKEEYKKQLKEVCTAMTDDDIDKAVDTVFGKLDKITGYADKAVDAFDIVTSIIANQELELEVIDELIVSLQDSRDRDLYEGLVMIRNDVTSNIGTYILENYLTDKAIGKVKGILADAVYDAASGIIGTEITTFTKVIVDVAISIAVVGYEKYNPSVSAIMHTTIMYNYALTLETAVLKYKTRFYKKEATEEDIQYFKAAYTAELCAVKLMMEYAKGLTSNKSLKNSLDIYREELGGKTVNCTGYINYYRMLATKDINAGILTVTDEGSTQKTPDGTIIDDNYDSTESIKAKYAEIQKKYPPDESKTWKESYGGAIQCFGFARMVFNLLFGCDMPSAYKGSKRYEYVDNTNVTVIGQLSGSNVTAENMKKLVSQGKLGDVTQGYGVPYGQHTMILQEVKDTGATFYQCNYLNEDCLIYTGFYTWEYLANRYGEGDSTSGNGFTLYRANNYGMIYGDGSDLFYDDSVNFVINDGVLVKYNGWQSHVEIPDTVMAIGDGAFKSNTTMMTVDIPDSVTSIENKAFYGCTNLIGVLIPDSVESIGNQAFYGCTNLSSVQLPENEKFCLLSGSCFENCKNLKRLNIPNSVTEIGAVVFRNCEKLTDVDLPNKLKKIGWGVFAYVPITRITIPKSLEKVDASGYNGPFAYCSTLKEIEFEEGVTRIPQDLFAKCSGIEEVVIPNTVTIIESGSFVKCNNLKKVVIPDTVTEIRSIVFADCEKLTDIDLPNKLKRIGWGVFQNVPITRITIPKSLEKADASGYSGPFAYCSTLKEIEFEEGVTRIPQELFAKCSGIEEVVIPNTVTIIESGSFVECNNLKKVVIPDTVTEIRSIVFADCEKLTDIDLPNKLKRIGWGVFQNVPITRITIPKSLEKVDASGYSGPFAYCSTLKEIEFEEGITRIPQELFAKCSGIEEVVIPNTITIIESGGFAECSNLKKVTIPNTVTKLGSSVFENCKQLSEIKLPNGINKIEFNLFIGCSKLASIALPDTITCIESSAFRNSGLTELTLPENVTAIENYAFDNCTNLAKVNLNTGLKTIGNYAFRNNDELTEITIPNSVTTIGSYAFQDSDALTTAAVSDSVTSIGQYIFAHCDSLKDVTLGTGLTKIPAYAFDLCPALEKIILPYRITTVEANAFTNCTKLTEVTVPRSTTSISTSAFSYPDRLTIYGISGTYAETYAKEIGATFVNKEVNATDIILSETALSMMKGAKHTLVMRVVPSDFTDEVVWKSSDTSILTVDNMGVVTANAVGTANIRVAVGEKTAVCTVTVVQPVTSISLDKSSLSLRAFEEYTLTATVSPANAADKSIEWTTSDETIATVSQTGTVTPLARGTATITATAKDGSGKYGSCKVTVTSEGELCTWYSGLESAHNYENNTNKIWKYVHSGAKTLDLTFDSRTNVDDGFDYLYIYDSENREIRKATGTELANETVHITGDTVMIQLVSDEAVTAWGFKIVKLSADGKEIDSGEENPEEPPTEESPTEEESSIEESSTEESDENIKEGFYITGLKTKTYTGSAIQQDIRVYYNRHLLKQGTDYTLSYKNNIKAGTASLTIKAKGNLTGTVTKTFEIRPREITDSNVIIEDAVYSYDKKPHKKAPAISYNGKTLKKGKDFEVTDYGAGDYTAVGTYTIKVKGIGNYTGSFDKAQVIIVDKSRNLSKAKISQIPAQEYKNGSPVVLTDIQLKVTLNGTALIAGTDYSVTYVNNKNPGKATVVIKGIGEYAGTKKAVFTIKRTPTALTDGMIVNKSEISTVEIQKNGAMPKPQLTSDGYRLAEGKDYTVSYKNNKKAGTGTIIIKGRGNYNKQLKIPFTITTKSLTSPDLTVRVPDAAYTGKRNKYQSKPVITDSDGGVLTLNKDYTIESYYADTILLDKKSNPANGTEITVTIKGKGNYSGTLTMQYLLKGISLSKAAIKITAKPYTGDQVTLEASDITSAVIKIGKNKTPLQFGIDYEIAAYKNNIKKGTATVIFKGKGDYAGEKAVRFKIKPAAISSQISQTSSGS